MPRRRPPLSVEQILAWADAHCARTGEWPTPHSGPVPEAPGETWAAVQSALYQGLRGLPRGTSLARLLAGRRGKSTRSALPRLSQRQILEWADAHRRRTGRWPAVDSGAVAEAPAETWRALDAALRRGYRGLPGGDSLARLLDRRRGPRLRSWRSWTGREDDLVRKLPPAEAARRTGRTVRAVYKRRWGLGLARRQEG
jgi:hypothetical protein